MVADTHRDPCFLMCRAAKILAIEDAGDEEQQAAHEERHVDAGLENLRVAIGSFVDLARVVDGADHPQQRPCDQHVDSVLLHLVIQALLFLHAYIYICRNSCKHA